MLQSWLEAVFGFSVLSPGCLLASYHYFIPGDHVKKELWYCAHLA